MQRIYAHCDSEGLDTNLQLYAIRQAAREWKNLCALRRRHDKNQVPEEKERLVFVLVCLGLSLSQLLGQYSKYVGSGEINSEVSDQAGAMAKVRRAFAGRPDLSTDELDGLTITAPDWWFNLRPSNTEPLLRLNVEAEDETMLARVTDEVLHIVREDT